MVELMGPRLTPLTKRLLVGLGVLYVAELVAENWLGLPVSGLLAWWPLGTGAFRPWQPISSLLLGGPDPLSAALSWLGIAFLLPPTEETLGTRGALRVLGFAILVSAGLALGLDALGGIKAGSPFLGQGALLTALLCLFGLLRPHAQILLFFVLPVRAGWIAWATGLLAFLGLLARRDLSSALWVGGWIAAWLWLNGAGRVLRAARRWWESRRRVRKVPRVRIVSERDEQIYH